MTTDPHDFNDLPDPLLDDARSRDVRGFVPELLRKAAVAGLGAIFMTEEGVRNLAGQLKLPKEALTSLLAQAEKTKDDIGRVISEEVRRFLQSEKLKDELMKVLAGASVEVTAQIRLVPTTKGPEDEAPTEHKPKVSVTHLSARRHGKGRKKDS